MTPEERERLRKVENWQSLAEVIVAYNGERIEGILEAIDNLAPGDDLAALRARVTANAESLADFGARLRAAGSALGGSG